MGLELSVARLNAMKKDVFGLGTSQFLVTAAVGSAVSIACGLPTAAAVTIGGSLALSSSAFVLQLLKDKDAMGTRHGKASFGILLLQDLAVVPLLVVVELLAKGGTGLGKALSIAGNFTHPMLLDSHLCLLCSARLHVTCVSFTRLCSPHHLSDLSCNTCHPFLPNFLLSGQSSLHAIRDGCCGEEAAQSDLLLRGEEQVS